MNSRVGIITFHRAINYGALLQVYALHKSIERLGANPVVLDYYNPILENKHEKSTLLKCKTLKDYIRFAFLARHYNRKHDKFRSFATNNLNISKPYYSLDDLRLDSASYDRFVCGSDQVWNGSITGLDPAYFLHFADNQKRNSYAASFGFREVAESEQETYKNLLMGFQNMSVREKQGAEIVRRLLGREVEVVLDPTLLLTADEWSKISVEPKYKDYILIYGFGGYRNLIDFAINLSKKTGLKIVNIANPYLPKFGFSYERSAGPAEFLGLFKNASYIVTNSFHGTVFSINFNKEFFTEMLPESQGVNSRLEDVLDLFDLRNRQILSDDVSESDRPIDYKLINTTLELEREKSLSFLRKIICE